MASQTKETVASGYSYCPHDGTRLVVPSDVAAITKPTCRECGFIDFGNPKPCVAVLVEKDGGILLARRAIEPAKGLWDIPGGFIDASETAEEAVAREILEETGLQLTEIRYLMSVADVYGERGVPTLNLCFTARPENWPPRADSDVAELMLVLPDELPSQLAFPHQRLVLRAWIRRLGE